MCGENSLFSLGGFPEQSFQPFTQLGKRPTDSLLSRLLPVFFWRNQMDKLISRSEAVSKIKSGDTLMVGGFGLVGSPLGIIEELSRSSVKDLTIISNNLGEPGKGLGKLVL